MPSRLALLQHHRHQAALHAASNHAPPPNWLKNCVYYGTSPRVIQGGVEIFSTCCFCRITDVGWLCRNRSCIRPEGWLARGWNVVVGWLGKWLWSSFIVVEKQLETWGTDPAKGPFYKRFTFLPADHAVMGATKLSAGHKHRPRGDEQCPIFQQRQKATLADCA